MMMTTKAGALLLLGAGSAAGESANPIRKVVTLMQEMQKEIELEGEKEANLYKKFECYCKSNTENMSTASAEASEKIKELDAKTQAELAEKQQIQQELKQHKADRNGAKQDLAKAEALRKKEKAEYDEATKESKANLEACDTAISSLEKGMGAKSFLQSSPDLSRRFQSLIQSFEGKSIGSDEKEEVLAFITQSGDYIPASGQIVGILKNMKDEMDKNLGGVVSEEKAAVTAFLDLKGAKESEIQAATDAIENKTERSGQLAVSIVQNKGASADATKSLEDSEEFAANLKVMCGQKSEDMEVRVKERVEEVAAINEAIKVLNSDDALDTFRDSIGNNVKKTSFLQLRKNSRAMALNRAKNLLGSTQFKSASLALLASSVNGQLKALTKSKMDFSKVVAMVDEMVTLLKQEQVDDDKHQEYCVAEFHTSETEETDVKRKITTLSSAVEEMEDEIAHLVEDVTALTKENEELDKSVAAAGDQRKEESSDYQEKIHLNEAAVGLIAKAKNRLQKFYNPKMYQPAKERDMTREEELGVAAGGEMPDLTAPAFIQIRQHKQVVIPEAPETFDGDYKKKGSKSNAVMGLMDRLSNDLSKDTQEAGHEEESAEKEYTKLIDDATGSKMENSKAIADKSSSKAEIEGKVQESKTQTVIANDQLETITEYIGNLHSSCDFLEANYEIRKAARESELESLTNAKSVLAGASFK